MLYCLKIYPIMYPYELPENLFLIHLIALLADLFIQLFGLYLLGKFQKLHNDLSATLVLQNA